MERANKPSCATLLSYFSSKRVDVSNGRIVAVRGVVFGGEFFNNGENATKIDEAALRILKAMIDQRG
jgi:hypothetical protein